MRRIFRHQRKRDAEPARCKCQGGGDRASQHAKPGSTAADHGEPFAGVRSCIHSQLQQTTRLKRKQQGMGRADVS